MTNEELNTRLYEKMFVKQEQFRRTDCFSSRRLKF
mgnify:FL=1